MTVIQKNTAGVIAWPFAGNAGCACYTFNAAATPAQLAEDPTLFEGWSSLVAAVQSAQAPVEVTFLSSATVPFGKSQFFPGSTFIGQPSAFPTLTMESGAALLGVTHFSDFQIVNKASEGTIASDSDGENSWLVFEGCEFDVTTPLTVYTLDESVLVLVGCDSIGGTGPVFEFKGANTFQLLLSGGTTLRSDALKCEDVAGTLIAVIDGSGAVSSLQSNKGASFTIRSSTSAPVVGETAGQMFASGVSGTWPTPADDKMQLMTAFLAVNNTSGGSIDVILGNTNGFTDGQELRVQNMSGAAASVVQLKQVGGNNIVLLTPGAGGPAAGKMLMVTLKWTSFGDAGSPGWQPVSSFNVSS